MTLQTLQSWWNLIYVVPFALALLYLGLYTISGITFGDADSDMGGDLDADMDADLDADVDGDIHLDGDPGLDAHPHVELDADGDMNADADTDADSDAHVAEGDGPGFAMSALHWLGVGRVPLSIVLMVLLLTWGWFGFVTNVILQARVSAAWHIPAISLPIALICSLIFTKAVVSVVARWLPNCESNARRRHELLGSVGEAVFAINEKFGLSSIRDTQGDLYQVPCRVEDGEPIVPKGKRVKLVAYNAKQGIFRVIPWENREPAPIAEQPGSGVRSG